MSKLDEIFKTYPELLEQPEVKELIEYCTEVHNKTVKIASNYKDFHDEVLHILMYSENFLVNGTTAKEALDKIEKAVEKF